MEMIYIIENFVHHRKFDGRFLALKGINIISIFLYSELKINSAGLA